MYRGHPQSKPSPGANGSIIFLPCEINKKKKTCMLCACSTIMFSGQEGYSFTFALFFLFRKRPWVCAHARVYACVLFTCDISREECLFSCSCSICLSILFIDLFPPGIQLKWRLLKAFAESIKNSIYIYICISVFFYGHSRQYFMKILNHKLGFKGIILKVWFPDLHISTFTIVKSWASKINKESEFSVSGGRLQTSFI